MRAPRSITRILLFRLALLFVLAPVLAFVVTLVIGEQDTNARIDVVMERKADAVAPLLNFDRRGSLALDTRALHKPLLAGLRFAIYQNDAHRPILRFPADLKMRSWDFFSGYQTVRNVNHQPLRILFAPPRNTWTPWLAWFAGEMSDETLPLLAVLMCICLPLAALTVRYGLKPVRILSHEAARIEPGYRSARLSEEDVPSELLPLVRAVNGGLERLDAGLASQRRFSAIVAHELRTPIAALLMQLEHERWTDGSARPREQLHLLRRLVEQLLTISELTSKHVRTDAIVDVAAVARETVAQEVPSALDAGVIVDFDGPKRPMPFKGNAAAIGTALRNLISNAVRHSPSGDHVIVRVLPSECAIEVCDRGEGIDEAQRRTIFEPFWKRPSSTGRGLGLAIVREMADLHGASVSVRSNRPSGTIFRIEFPKNESGSAGYQETVRSGIDPPNNRRAA